MAARASPPLLQPVHPSSSPRSSNFSPRSSVSSKSDGTVWMDLLMLGQPIKYTIPQFSVITVNLRHGVMSSEIDFTGKVKQINVLLRDSTELSTKQLRTTIKVLESCYCDVRELYA